MCRLYTRGTLPTQNTQLPLVGCQLLNLIFPLLFLKEIYMRWFMIKGFFSRVCQPYTLKKCYRPPQNLFTSTYSIIILFVFCSVLWTVGCIKSIIYTLGCMLCLLDNYHLAGGVHAPIVVWLSVIGMCYACDIHVLGVKMLWCEPCGPSILG